jgi:hypothetical protein
MWWILSACAPRPVVMSLGESPYLELRPDGGVYHVPTGELAGRFQADPPAVVVPAPRRSGSAPGRAAGWGS